MNSCLYVGEVWHSREQPVRHRFRYPVYVWALDLDELDTLDRRLPAFGHNRPGLVSFYDRDYLFGSGPLRERLLAYLQRHGIAGPIGRIDLVTSARLLQYAFNPVSFYYCYRPDGPLACVLVEVNNTFGERHLYLLDGADDAPRYTAAKRFHVSPFFDRSGEYRFRLPPPGERLQVQIDLYREGRLAMASRLTGERRPLTGRSLAATLLQFPLNTFLTMPRILWEAAKLYVKRGLPVYSKPDLAHVESFRTAPPSPLERVCLSLVLAQLKRIRLGRLRLTLPNREEHQFGDPKAVPVRLQVKSYALFAALVLEGDIGFGDGFVAGHWETDDLTGLLRLFVANRPYLDDRQVGSWAGQAVNRLRHLLRRNSLSGSARNIQAHYDLSNQFFQAFLDPSLMYSCALFGSPEESLAEAQRRKNRTIIAKAQLKESDHVLEIGSGWGSFAITAVQETGCRVTTITLSTQQFALATERVAAAGLSDRITVLLQDYRTMTGSFDKIVSIEMLEAVGHEYYGTFFATCDRLLKPGGLAVIQVITIADQRYEAYRRGSDWIQQRIFPGGLVPSLTALTAAMTASSAFVVESLQNIGPHYARTLREWRDRFWANRAQIRALGFDERFERTWLYYLAYCEAGFLTRQLGTLHLVLSRPG